MYSKRNTGRVRAARSFVAPSPASGPGVRTGIFPMASVRPEQRRSRPPTEARKSDPRASGSSTSALAAEEHSASCRELHQDAIVGQIADQLETEVIPRLLLAHRISKESRTAPDASSRILLESSVRARQLSTVALKMGPPGVITFIDELLAGGEMLDRILVDVVAGAARDMGQRWETDELNFVDVTIGVANLQHALRHYSAGGRRELNGGGSARKPRACFIAPDNEQHTFGMLIVEEAFRASGWEVWSSSENSFESLRDAVKDIPFDVAGFTLANETHVNQLAVEIDTLRTSSCSASLAILVGGSIFLKNPDLWKLTGADAMAADAIDAVRLAEKLSQSDSSQNEIAIPL